jgi:hypothetical protein
MTVPFPLADNKGCRVGDSDGREERPTPELPAQRATTAQMAPRPHIESRRPFARACLLENRVRTRLAAGEEWIRTFGSAILIMLRKTGLSETDQCMT